MQGGAKQRQGVACPSVFEQMHGTAEFGNARAWRRVDWHRQGNACPSAERQRHRDAKQRHSDERPGIAMAKDGSVHHRKGTAMDCKQLRGHSGAKPVKAKAKYG